MTTIDLLKKTKAAWGSIRSANAEEKNRLLLSMAESLEANQADILRENQKDMDAARGSKMCIRDSYTCIEACPFDAIREVEIDG